MPEAFQYHSILFPYAYNILGSVADAEDVVGNVLLNFYAAGNNHAVQNERSYLIKSVINRAITAKQRQKRTLREGESWLPEPVATDDAADRNLELSEILSYSLLVLLEKLSAMERAVFILRESFDYSHEEIATALNLSIENSRKLLSRAKNSLYKPVVRSPVQTARQKEVLEKFIKAIRERNTKELEQLMAVDIQFQVDGGGKVPFLSGNCSGSSAVSSIHLKVFERYLHAARFVITDINHQPALLSFVSNKLVSCQIFEIQDQKNTILQINTILDPRKLQLLKPKFI